MICTSSPTCKRISISQAATLVNIPTLPTQIRDFLYCTWGHDAECLLWGAREDFKYEVQVVPHNEVRIFTAVFHTPLNFTSGLLDCSVQNVPGCINKWPPQVVWERLDNNGNDGLRGRHPAFPLLYFTCTLPIKLLDIQNVIRNS